MSDSLSLLSSTSARKNNEKNTNSDVEKKEFKGIGL